METRVTLPEPPEEYNKNDSSSTKRREVTVICFRVTEFGVKTQFIISVIAVFVTFVAYGYLQELIFTVDGFKPYGWYLTLVQFGFYSIFAFTECKLTGSLERRIPMKTYALLAFLTLGTIGFSNSSLSHLNYPTQVIFKCCKLIPVMIGSILIQKKRYNSIDVSAAVSMCIGLSLFTLADSKVSPHFSAVGVFMISCALLCDAVIGNVQEKSMNAHNATNKEVVLYSYSIGFVYLFIIMALSGHLEKGIVFCLQKPIIYLYAMIFSLAGYLGVQVVLTLVRTFGALIAVTVTTCRKAVSIVISFIFFAKPFTLQYLWGGGLVLLGIYLNLLSKRMSQNKSGPQNLYEWLKSWTSKRQKLKTFETTV